MVQLDLNVVLLLLDEKVCIRTVFLKHHVNWSEREDRRCCLPKYSFVQQVITTQRAVAGSQGRDFFFSFFWKQLFGATVKKRRRGRSKANAAGNSFYYMCEGMKKQAPAAWEALLCTDSVSLRISFQDSINSPGPQLHVWLCWMWSGVSSPSAETWKHLGCRSPT